MKGSKKKPSLLHSHRESDLKDMLAYYNDKSKILHQDPNTFEPIYEYDQLPTEEIMLPKSSFENFTMPIGRTVSETYRKKNRQSSPMKDSDIEAKNRGRVSFSRESVSDMNKRLREIRTSHYRRYSQKMNDVKGNNSEKDSQDQGMVLSNEFPLNGNSLVSKKGVVTAQGYRAMQQMLKNSAPDLIQRGSEGSFENIRPMQKNQNNVRIRSPAPLLRHNPHVIYQFQSHLKAKRIDDNPKVLGSIIRKKFRFMERDNLFDFINGLIKRREK